MRLYHCLHYPQSLFCRRFDFLPPLPVLSDTLTSLSLFFQRRFLPVILYTSFLLPMFPYLQTVFRLFLLGSGLLQAPTRLFIVLL